MLKEPTTTITDFIMGLESLILVVLLIVSPLAFPSLPYWIITVLCVGIGTILGGVYHGFERSSSYTGIYLCIAVLMATFCLAVTKDNFSQEMARSLHWPIAGLALLFFLTTRIYPGKILAFAAVLAVVLLGAFSLYLRSAVIGAFPGAWLLATGIGTLLAGTVMMLGNVRFKLVWNFDRFAVYHLFLMISLLLLYLGLCLRSTVSPQ